MTHRKPELLIPASSLEVLKTAVIFGADAVYIGGSKYSLRANATNFTIDEIKEACSFAHNFGKKVYQTINIVFHNENIDGIYDYLKECVDAGIDAFIVSDPFIISYIVKNFPNVEVHVSTQNSTTNIETVNFFKKEGVKRVVPARELSKKEIKELCDTGVDIEVFIHGAMCTFYSGRCTLSNYVTNRDSNRGGCSQVCRFAFDLDTDSDTKFTMATKDLNMARHIKDMIDIGVNSFKVEGRMRSLYYLATVIGTYREIIDRYYDKTLTEENMAIFQERLNKVANRETSTHYFVKEADFTDQYYTGRGEASNQDYLGQVISYENGLLEFYERNYFEVGDVVELFTPEGQHIEFVVEELFNKDKNVVDVARHPDDIYYLKIDTDISIPEYSMLKVVRRKNEIV